MDEPPRPRSRFVGSWYVAAGPEDEIEFTSTHFDFRRDGICYSSAFAGSTRASLEGEQWRLEDGRLVISEYDWSRHRGDTIAARLLNYIDSLIRHWSAVIKGEAESADHTWLEIVEVTPDTIRLRSAKTWYFVPQTGGEVYLKRRPATNPP